MRVRKIFTDIENEFNRYASTVNDIFADYRRKVEAAKVQCARYKNEKTEFEREKAGLAATARRAVEAADQELHDHVTKYSNALRMALSEHICTAAPPALVQTLRNYKDFGLEPSRMEVDALVRQADGNYQSLQLLQAVTSKFRLDFPTVENYETDLARIERAARAPVLYVPSGFSEEGHEILPDARRYLPSGESYCIGRPTAALLAMRVGEIGSDRAALSSMADRWTCNVVPDVSDFEPIETEKGDIISPARQHHEATQAAAEGVGVSEGDGGVAFAHKLGQQRAEQAAASLDRFTE